MTIDIDEYYGVTIRHGEKIGPRRWQAKASIFRRDTHQAIGELYAEGGAMTSADSKVLSEAKMRIASLGIPDNWQRKGQTKL